MAPSKCVFCEICAKRQPAEIMYEDNEVVVFKDIKPVTQHHYLCVPKKHIQDINKLTMEDKPLVERLIAIGKQILEENGCNLDDVRLGFHTPPFNSVGHLHLHVIAPASEMSFISRGVFMPNTWWFTTAEIVLQRLES